MIQASKATYFDGMPYAEYYPLFNKWSANSQYGYTLEWFDTENEAVAYAEAYYAARPHLLAQWER